MFNTALVARDGLSAVRPFVLRGRVESVGALSVEISGLAHHLAVGDRVELLLRDGTPAPAEIVGAHGRCLQAAPFGGTLGIGAGAAVIAADDDHAANARTRRSGGLPLPPPVPGGEGH